MDTRRITSPLIKGARFRARVISVVRLFVVMQEMRMMNFRIIVFVVALLIASATPTFACVCAETTFDEMFAGVKATFSGKVVKAEYQKGIVSELMELQAEHTGKKVEYEVLVVTFEVERWWKGDTTSEVSIVTEQIRDANGKIGISTCENEYVVGEKYLVFAYADKDRLISGTCTPTNKLDKAEKELTLLGEGKEPEKPRKASGQ